MSILEHLRKKKKENISSPSPKREVIEQTGEGTKEVQQTSAASMSRKAWASTVLLRPLVTEKCAELEAHGTYGFMVALRATSMEIKKAVHVVYGVLPKRVTTLRVAGKNKRMGRTAGKRKTWKKAFVELPKGKTISIHEGV